MARWNDFSRPEEDWTGLKDPKARRKLQNRLNVRAHRRRKAKQDNHTNLQDIHSQPSDAFSLLPHFKASFPLVLLNDFQLPLGPGMNIETYARSTEWNRFSRLEFSARVRFPLSSDHLLSLAQYNLVRASTTNAMILSVHHLIDTDHCGIDFENMPLFSPSSTFWETPESLRPTKIQLQIPHDFWVDLIPDPQLRDNVLLALAQGALDTVEFQGDLVGYICKETQKTRPSPFGSMPKPEIPFSMAANWNAGPGCSLSEQRELGILVWSDPWRMEGYEVTPAFFKKWKFLFKGCQHIVESTNRWRERRGEEPLVVEL
ncbi:unnamed protein product [Clonostachys rosea f. rosea IK726]|uniref:Uncharacterized protein n=1 Tax=Clonostachys rosea f. rosea IK726 TaxID=1349383 RepID=A0ACA9UIW7_BIOOC|nr:unnamed protein product [Clonostachys rosea f. rosea IK726]